MGRYVGLISGTSHDGVDAALVETDGQRCELIRFRCAPLDDDLKRRLGEAMRRGAALVDEDLGELDRELAERFAEVALELVAAAGLTPADIAAIGSHGQTLYHDALADPPISLQLGDPARVATMTGIITVGDFRRADLDAGGQGAPLAPAFHAAVLGSAQPRAVLNLGGIANLTVLAPERPVRGFDVGPANVLLDVNHQRHRAGPYDEGGAWAASGRVDQGLLQALLEDPYFRAPPPKSADREDFGAAWLERHLTVAHDPADLQATLAELTATVAVRQLEAHAPASRELLVCGGGVHNAHLMARLAALSPVPVRSVAELGLDPDAIEACLFGWLAARRLADLPGNIPEVTGADAAVVLGQVFDPTVR